MKTCRVCNQTKPLSDFYKRADMKDGHLNNCKECHNAKSIAWTRANKERVNANNRKRAKTDAVKEKRKQQYTSEKGRQIARAAVQRYRRQKPMIDVAHRFVRLAIAKGLLVRETACSECGDDRLIEAHHDDYTKPEIVRWLCKHCHESWHRLNKPIYENQFKKDEQ